MPDLFAAGMSEIVPRWSTTANASSANGEIAAEDHRLAAARQDGWGKIVVWTVLEVMWLAVVFAVLGLVSRL
jgi:hypothetical protein